MNTPNFNYKFLVGKHVPDISHPNVSIIDKVDLVEDMLEVAPLFGIVRSHVLNTLIHESKTLQEIISTSSARKEVCEGIINMLSP